MMAAATSAEARTTEPAGERAPSGAFLSFPNCSVADNPSPQVLLKIHSTAYLALACSKAGVAGAVVALSTGCICQLFMAMNNLKMRLVLSIITVIA
jgi:hypothetical protein